jgi:hypothetical protein
MKTTTHTQAPWHLSKYKNIVLDLNNYVVGVAPYAGYGYSVGNYITQELIEANARLIAAAPELLEAVKQLHELWPSKEGRERFADLINKATGRA